MSNAGRQEISRRNFIRGTAAAIGGLIGALVGIPSVAYLLSPAIQSTVANDSVIALGPMENYPVGIPIRFEFTQIRVNTWERTATNYGLYVVKRSEHEVRVFSDICTHLGCRVSWHDDQKHYVSPCHNGHFDVLGNVVSGPPPRPLDEFITKIEDGNLFVQLPAFKRTS